MEKLSLFVCFWCLYAIRDTSTRLENILDIELETSHFEIAKHAHNASLVGEINGIPSNDNFEGREAAHFPIQSIDAQHDQDTPVWRNSSARLPEVVTYRSAANPGVKQQDQDGPDVAWQRVSHVPSDEGEYNDHGVDSSVQNPGGMFQKGSSITSVEVFAKGITTHTKTKGQLSWSISSHMFAIDLHVAVMISLLVACVACACPAFLMRRGSDVTEKNTENPGVVDMSGYESSSHSFGDNQDFDYSGRLFPEEEPKR